MFVNKGLRPVNRICFYAVFNQFPVRAMIYRMPIMPLWHWSGIVNGLQQIDRRLGLNEAIARILDDPRRQASCDHNCMIVL